MKILSESYHNTPNFDKLTSEFMPAVGAGETMLSGLLVAANKIIFRWYNDGDVFDNTENGLPGFANDISGSANWLYKYAPNSIFRSILDRVYVTYTEDLYEALIVDLEQAMEKFASNSDLVEDYKNKPLEGDPYDEPGRFEYVEWSEEEEEDWFEEEEEEDWY